MSKSQRRWGVWALGILGSVREFFLFSHDWDGHPKRLGGHPNVLKFRWEKSTIGVGIGRWDCMTYTWKWITATTGVVTTARLHIHAITLLSASGRWRAHHHRLAKKAPLTYSITSSKGVSLRAWVSKFYKRNLIVITKSQWSTHIDGGAMEQTHCCTV